MQNPSRGKKRVRTETSSSSENPLIGIVEWINVRTLNVIQLERRTLSRIRLTGWWTSSIWLPRTSGIVRARNVSGGYYRRSYFVERYHDWNAEKLIGLPWNALSVVGGVQHWNSTKRQAIFYFHQGNFHECGKYHYNWWNFFAPNQLVSP